MIPYEADHSEVTFDAETSARALLATHGKAPAEKVLLTTFETFEDRFALVSSFGAESAVLLHIASTISKTIPVLFLDTGKLFPETIAYRDKLIEHLDLRDVRILTPDESDLTLHDPKGLLHQHQTNQCCYIRKVVPLDKALEGFDAWASGRKRFQSAKRDTLEHFEASDNRVKVNPMAHWTKDDVGFYLDFHNLPRNPLIDQGYRSIGCAPCTDPVTLEEDDRAGRWRTSNKTECGIHLSKAENATLASMEGANL